MSSVRANTHKLSQFLLALLAAFALCFALVGCSSNTSSNDSQTTTEETQTEVVTTEPTTTSTQLPEGSTFSVTYLDVGQGDGAIIECDGHYMLIDGGDSSKSSFIYSYFKSHGITHLDYLIATHPDTDHTGGISGALQLASVDRAFCSVTTADQKAFNSMVKYLDKQGVSLEVPSAGDTFELGSATVQIVGPVYSADSSNDRSIMAHITYGDTGFMFTGDASTEEENAAVSKGYNLKSNVLKVGHHGSAYSSGTKFLSAVGAEYAVISVGKDNSYGHPTTEALTRLTNSGAEIFRTDLQGNITATSDGKTVTITTQKTASTDTAQSSSSQNATNDSEYIGNKNTKKFHRTTCKNLPAEKNRVTLSSREEAINQGYTPCSNCNP